MGGALIQPPQAYEKKSSPGLTDGSRFWISGSMERGRAGAEKAATGLRSARIAPATVRAALRLSPLKRLMGSPCESGRTARPQDRTRTARISRATRWLMPDAGG